jgi:hypothetical protein
MKRIPALCFFLSLLLTPAAFATASVASYVEVPDASTIAVDWSKGSTQAVTLHGNHALTFSNGQKGGKYLLILRQDATGSRTVAWPSSVRWPGGPPQTGGQPANILTTFAGKKDYFTFFYDGVTYDAVGFTQNL